MTARGTGPSTTTQHALDHLRAQIVSGELAPGERVGQEQIADRLGISVAPVREALRILEREGQLTYRPRRGYIVTELNIADLEEIYELRRILESRLVAAALPAFDEDTRTRIGAAARECVDAAEENDIAHELAANRRFHFAILEPAEQPHALRLVDLLWDSTEAYRALYYAVAGEQQRAIDAHDRILAATADRDAEPLIAALDEHRERALVVLREILPRASSTAPRTKEIAR